MKRLIKLETGNVVYYSRSRKALWRKGETSGQTQELIDMRIDCDRDAILLDVLQKGVACHTGRKSCFSWAPGSNGMEPVEPIETDPDVLYRGDQ